MAVKPVEFVDETLAGRRYRTLEPVAENSTFRIKQLLILFAGNTGKGLPMIQTAIATETYYAPLVFHWTVFAGFFILGPLTIFQRTRPAAAIGFLIAACVLAFLLWFATALQVYAYWGLGAVVLASLGFLVPGTVIAAVIGTLLYGTAFELLGLGIIIVVTLAAIAVAIVLNKDRLASYA